MGGDGCEEQWGWLPPAPAPAPGHRAQCLLSPPVLYDACPKSLRSGVWWPQTKFGVLASVPCPRGALGESLGGAGMLLRISVGLAGATYFPVLGGLVPAKRWERVRGPRVPLTAS